jgi:hypothetical protein
MFSAYYIGAVRRNMLGAGDFGNDALKPPAAVRAAANPVVP